VTWLGELDFITDDRSTGGSDKQFASLFEADWRIAKGHNLNRLEFLDPNNHTSGDRQQRTGRVGTRADTLLQVRVGMRTYSGPAAQPFTEPQRDVRGGARLLLTSNGGGR